MTPDSFNGGWSRRAATCHPRSVRALVIIVAFLCAPWAALSACGDDAATPGSDVAPDASDGAGDAIADTADGAIADSADTGDAIADSAIDTADTSADTTLS